MKKFGFNALDCGGELLPQAAAHPGTVVTLVAGGPGQMLNEAAWLLQGSPYTRVIYRIWSMDGNGYNRMDMGRNIAEVTHEMWWSAYWYAVQFFEMNNLLDRVYIDTWNEANTEGNQDAYHEWHTTALDWADDFGVKLCLCNYGTGSPEFGTYDTSSAIAFYKRMAERGWQDILGYHEYTNRGGESVQEGFGYHIGRYTNTVNAMQAAGIDTDGLKIVFTELGFGDGINKDMGEHGRSQSAILQDIGYMFDLYDADPNVLGSCWFTWSELGGWGDHALSTCSLWGTIKSNWEVRSASDLVEEEEEPVTYTLIDIANTEYTTLYQMNLRTGPSTSDIVSGSVPASTTITVDAYVEVNDYRWFRIQNTQAFIAGWKLDEVDEQGVPYDPYLVEATAVVEDPVVTKETVYIVSTIDDTIGPLLIEFFEKLAGFTTEIIVG